ncbi:Nuclear inhibitor of protein phosphatase 1 [Oopsacas minuta]|uniref:Nuclear inhibitor of protein phosphatase 1 n=1 Tax=Oopsacas minuta TaxID=111878 RepID=A0AAV7JNX1_9METZ|nr:Nuclear inhibitor of protein phosphatase 1 [Oopsacas minuta]
MNSIEPFVFDCPKWACKPPPSCGLYFDVIKNTASISKLLLDDKPYYLIGRHSKKCDFILDHASVSRFHSAVIYHKHLQRIFLMDLGSTHGTFIGSLRLEPHKPQVLPVDSTIYFGQSTRCYTLRERKPESSNLSNALVADDMSTLQENQVALADLTQYNTALNRSITVTNDNSAIQTPNPRKIGSKHITFSPNPEEIINPEDVDPSIGRFRNMVQSAFVPTPKKLCLEPSSLPNPLDSISAVQPFLFEHDNLIPQLYSSIDDPINAAENVNFASNFFSSAPVVNDPNLSENTIQISESSGKNVDPTSPIDLYPLGSPTKLYPRLSSHKKIYAKEIWPGKKSTNEKSNFLL